jgi:hypothetical protein
MTAAAKTPTRRTLATYPSQIEAATAAIWWQGPPERAKGVQVQQGVPGTTDTRPWGVTADKARAGGGS